VAYSGWWGGSSRRDISRQSSTHDLNGQSIQPSNWCGVISRLEPASSPGAAGTIDAERAC
jgi:hypothetical protein